MDRGIAGIGDGGVHSSSSLLTVVMRGAAHCSGCSERGADGGLWECAGSIRPGVA